LREDNAAWLQRGDREYDRPRAQRQNEVGVSQVSTVASEPAASETHHDVTIAQAASIDDLDHFEDFDSVNLNEEPIPVAVAVDGAHRARRPWTRRYDESLDAHPWRSRRFNIAPQRPDSPLSLEATMLGADFEYDSASDEILPLSDISLSPMARRLEQHSNSNTTPPAVPTSEEGIPEDLICSICMSLPMDPVLTPGDYMFCRPCIKKALSRSSECPVTRQPCTANDLRALSGFNRRLWSSVQVRCGHHGKGCAWRGSIADYCAHLDKCTLVAQDDDQKVASLKKQVEDLTSSNILISRMNATLGDENSLLKRDIENMGNQLDSMTTKVHSMSNDDSEGG